MSLASVVVLNYNYEKFLARAIDSVLAQDVNNIELIVVDDASSDGSRSIIESYGDRVIPVFRPQNGGHAAAMNSGFAASHGELVIFLDSDDFFYADAIRKILAVWTPEAAQVQSRMNLVDADERVREVYPPIEAPFDSGDVRPKLMQRGRYNTTVTSGLAFSRSVLSQIMPMPEEAFRRSGDGYLTAIAPLFGAVVAQEGVIGGYRKHGANHSQFAEGLVTRAHWRLDHDEQRYGALAHYAGRLGLNPAPQQGLNDPMHLEERIASLALDKGRHPYPKDRRWALARHGLQATGSLRLSAARSWVLRAWWLACGLSPRPLAAALISWKLEDSSRPAWIRNLVRKVRAGTR